MRYFTGDLFEQKVNAVCVPTNGAVRFNGNAVMGAGLAKIAAERWPDLPEILGMSIKLFGNNVSCLKWIPKQLYYVCAFPTKENWRYYSTLDLVERSALQLSELAGWTGWRNVALPKVGTGLGGLPWKDVQTVLEKTLDDRFVLVIRNNGKQD